VSARKLLVRQAVIAVVVGVVIYLTQGLAAGIGYGVAFYVISTPLAIWVERRRARPDPGE
jgi:predicted PurR-regulated permease PerM